MIAIDPIEFIALENREEIVQSAQEVNMPLEVFALTFLNDFYRLRKIENVDKEIIKQELANHLNKEPEVPFPHGVERPTSTGQEKPSLPAEAVSVSVQNLSDIEFGKGVRVGPLETAGIKTLKELLSHKQSDLNDIPRLGAKSINLIIEWCEANGHTFIPEEEVVEAAVIEEPEPVEEPAAVEEVVEAAVVEEPEPVEEPAVVEEVVEEPAVVEEVVEAEEEEDFDFEALDDTLQGLKQAGVYYSQAYGLEGDDARTRLNVIVSPIFDNADESTIRPAINAVADAMPVTGDQYARVIDLGVTLGETQNHVTVTRPEALSGKSLAKMTRLEANTLIEEMEEESLTSKPEVGTNPF